MKEIEVKAIKYEAEDGTRFNTAYECQRYEAEIDDRKALGSAFQTIYKYCSEYGYGHYDYDTGEICGCENIKCPFNDGGIECKLCVNNTFERAYSTIYDDFAMGMPD